MNTTPPSIRLRSIAVMIRNRPIRTGADSYAVGKWLIEAKSLIAHGRFYEWIEANTEISTESARKHMKVARRIKAPVELLRGVKASAAQALARKRVARSQALTEKAFTAEPSRNGLIGLRAMQSAISESDHTAIHNVEAAKEGPIEALGRRLMSIANDSTITSVFLTFDRDEEELPAVAAVVMGDKRRSISRTTVMEAIAAIVGEEATIRCSACKRELSPSAFSKASHSCKTCERERVKAYSRRKRAEKQATKQRIEEIGT